MLDARAMPRMSDFENGDLAGRVRRMGCCKVEIVTWGQLSASEERRKERGTKTYLNERIAKDRSGYVADPHTREAGNTHVSQKHRSRFRSSKTEHFGSEYFVDILLAESGRQRESSQKEHDRGREHLTEDVSVVKQRQESKSRNVSKNGGRR